MIRGKVLRMVNNHLWMSGVHHGSLSSFYLSNYTFMGNLPPLSASLCMSEIYIQYMSNRLGVLTFLHSLLVYLFIPWYFLEFTSPYSLPLSQLTRRLKRACWCIFRVSGHRNQIGNVWFLLLLSSIKLCVTFVCHGWIGLRTSQDNAGPS